MLTFAVNGNPSLGLFADGEKTLDDAVTGRGAVYEEQVLVIEPGVCEFLGFVHVLVEADDGGDPVAVEVREVVIRGMKGVAVLYTTLVVGASKSKEFACREGQGEGRRKSEEGEQDKQNCQNPSTWPCPSNPITPIHLGTPHSLGHTHHTANPAHLEMPHPKSQPLPMYLV